MPKIEERWQKAAGAGLTLASGLASERTLVLARIWSRLPCPAVITLKRIGDIQVQPGEIAMFDELVHGQAEDMVWYQLARTSGAAWLGVTLGVCHGLIRAVLGGAAPLLIRPLSSAERGLMGAIVASALSSLGLAHRVTVACAEGQPVSQGQQVLLAGSIRGGTEIAGRVCFIGPLSWFAEGTGPAAVMASTENAVAEGVLELGRTLVPAADLAAAAPGDAVAFDGTPALVPGVAWPVNLIVGRSWVPAHLEPDSSLTLQGSWEQIDDSSAAYREENARWKPVEPRSPEAKDVTHASVNIIAELGRLSLRGDELAKLSKGGALVLGPRPGNPIGLWVAGQLWATGELVKLGEQLGVRILRLQAQGSASERTPDATVPGP